MTFNPDLWGWPQWMIAILLFIALAIEVTLSGQPKTDPSGEPYKYNGLMAFLRAALWIFPLIYGGFFGGHHG